MARGAGSDKEAPGAAVSTEPCWSSLRQVFYGGVWQGAVGAAPEDITS